MGSFEVERGQRYREGGQRGRCTERGQRYPVFEGAELELDPVASVSKLEHVTGAANYYLMGEAEYHFTGRLQGWNIRSSLGFDWGYTLGNNQGFQLTVSKRGLINPSKK